MCASRIVLRFIKSEFGNELRALLSFPRQPDSCNYSCFCRAATVMKSIHSYFHVTYDSKSNNNNVVAKHDLHGNEPAACTSENLWRLIKSHRIIIIINNLRKFNLLYFNLKFFYVPCSLSQSECRVRSALFVWEHKKVSYRFASVVWCGGRMDRHYDIILHLICLRILTFCHIYSDGY